MPALAVTVHSASTSEVTDLLLLAYGLTPRERDVLTRVLSGLPSRTIAAQLHITTATVQDHLKRIFSKAGVRTRSELVATVLGL